MKESAMTTDLRIPLVHLEIVRDSETTYNRAQVTTERAAADLFRQVIGRRNTENLLVCAVDVQKHPVWLQIIGIGTTSHCQFSIPGIWKAALISNASGIIVAHNHPSGRIDPSAEDIRVTEKMIAAGKVIGLPLIDHVIVTENNSYSFRTEMNDLWD